MLGNADSSRSVTMNPDGLPFCIDNAHPSVIIPLRFNQTKPQLVELLRLDFETNSNETVTLSPKDLRHPVQEGDGVSVYKYVAKKPGLYRLQKVIDKTKLEVQRRMSDTLVVVCPRGAIKATSSNKCIGDLSDLMMEIEGTAPLKVVYSRTANSEKSVHTFQSIQPENFVSPLLGSAQASTLVLAGSHDVSWAGTQLINVPLNESMAPGGRWLYSIDEIHDATGNVANFSSGADDGEHNYPKGAQLEQDFTVHERPVARLTGCDSRSPLMVATGKSVPLPVQYMSSGRTPDETSHTLTWKFSALDTLTKAGDHGDNAIVEEYVAKTAHNTPTIRESGLYTLTSVQSKFCNGEIREPASCLLINPPEPQLTITAENINDKCAGKPIGLLVDLDLIGTPPFTVRYDVISRGGSHSEYVKVQTSRHQLELKPAAAGHYRYHFTSLDDDVYKNQPLSGSDFVLEQDVKPPAHASLRPPPGAIDACIEEPIEINVDLLGEKPFTLEYEIVHEGKRKKRTEPNINTDTFKITTDPLLYGGEYSLALTSVKDTTGCKIFLNSEVKFNVRRQRPKVSFGHLDGKHETTEVEGKPVKLPLRLTGRPPWTIKYTNLDDPKSKHIEKTAKSTNDFITVSELGTYEILYVSDDQCPGTVDSKSSKFKVEWIPRPQIRVADTAVLIPGDNKLLKREVCEGDIDAVEVHLTGKKPLDLFGDYD